MRVDNEKKSDKVRVHHETRSDGVRVDNIRERAMDGEKEPLTMRKGAMG